MHTLCTPALCTLRPLGLLVSPDATPQLCALPALPCSAAPLSTHPILQRTLQPWILSLASNNRSAATLARPVGFPFWCVREPPRPAVVAQFPLPSGGCQLLWAFTVGGTLTLFHVPPGFPGLMHPRVWNVLGVFTCGPDPIPAVPFCHPPLPPPLFFAVA